jgi:hypothetical protein
MTVEDYLKNHCKVDLGYIAIRMWPNNKSALSYLSKKLHKKHGKTFTQADAKKAMKILSTTVINDLSDEFKSLTVD